MTFKKNHKYEIRWHDITTDSNEWFSDERLDEWFDDLKPCSNLGYYIGRKRKDGISFIILRSGQSGDETSFDITVIPVGCIIKAIPLKG